MSEVPPRVRVFRLPRLTYLVVLFLLFSCAPIAFTVRGVEGENAVAGPQTTVLLIPLVAAVFVARWATIATADGLTIRAAFGRRFLAWDDVRGLSVLGRSVYAVTDDGTWRLPCVHVADLGELSRASGGHLPQLADPKPKFAPQRRRRR